MVMLGAKGVILVYLCTLLSLSLSFAIGRLIPLKYFARFLGWLHLSKARDLVLKLEPLNPFVPKISSAGRFRHNSPSAFVSGR